MKKHLLPATLLFLLFIQTASAQIPTYNWAGQIGNTYSGYNEDLATDAAGNVYLIGTFSSPTAADFDPGTGVTSLTAQGSVDAFVAKYDANRILQWAFKIGSTSADEGKAIISDAAGNIYITGSYAGSNVDFDPSLSNSFTLPATSGAEMYVAKYNTAGVFQWAFDVKGTGSQYGNDISFDANGDILVTGFYQNTTDFDPSGNTVNLTGNGSEDAFVAKYDVNGNYLLAFKVGGNYAEQGLRISADNTNSIYVTGYFDDVVDFDPSGGTANLTAVNPVEVFVAKYSSTGIYRWAFMFGSSQFEFPTSMVYKNGAIYTTGIFQNTIDVDPNGTANLISNGDEDGYVAKYDTAGNYVWAFNLGGAGSDRVNDLVCDPMGNVLVTGVFYSITDFDPSGAINNLTPVGGTNFDLFVAKYGPSSSYQWAFSIGNGFNTMESNAIGVNSSYNIFISGFNGGVTDFDPSGSTTTSSGVNNNMFFAKYQDLAVGVEQSILNASVTIYPNPSSGKFTLDSKFTEGQLEIYNLLGDKIFGSEITDLKTEIDISSQPFGIYFLKVVCENKTYSVKLIKQ